MSLISNFNSIIHSELERHKIVTSWTTASKEIPFCHHRLTSDEMGMLVHFVEGFSPSKDTIGLHEGRDLPRKVFIDTAKKCLLVISEVFGDHKVEGKKRKICDAVEIGFKDIAKPQMQHVSWVVDKSGCSEREIEIAQRFAKIGDVAIFQRKDGEIAKGFVTKALTTDLFEIVDTLEPLDQVKILLSLAKQLQKMHSAGFVLANIDAEDVLLAKKADGSFEALFCNFKDAYKPKSKKFPLDKRLKESYGHKEFTAPEKQSVAIKQEIDPKKQAIAEDLFGFGCLIVELQVGEWFTEQAWGSKWLQELEALMKSEHDPIKKELLSLALKLCHFSPKKRLSLDNLCNQLEHFLL